MTVQKRRRNPAPLRDRKSLVRREGNIAFKCHYCDGGRSGKQAGFYGVCSDEIIRWNIETALKADKKDTNVWCAQPHCDCMRYYRGGISRRELDSLFESGGYTCYESQLLRDWRAMAGASRKGKPNPIRHAKFGGLCVLTTRMPGDTEAGRFIFGLFLADGIFEGDSEECGCVESWSRCRLKFPLEQARRLAFWNYYANSKYPENPRWNSGLFHYLSDAESVQILRDAVRVKNGTPDESPAREFLAHYCSLHSIDPAAV